MKKILMASILVLPLLSAACGDASAADLTGEARQALNSGDSATALKKFEQALKQLQATDEGYLEAKLGAIEARIPIDAEAAKDEFLELAKASPDTVGPRDYSFIGGHMANKAAWNQAVDVVHAGIQRYGEDAKLKALLENIKVQAKSNPELSDKLAGLGYL
jgi:hypothetical protein